MNFDALFKTWKHITVSIVALISTVSAMLGVAMKVDTRYAHAGQVEQGLKVLEKGQLRQERRYVQDKIRDIEMRGDRVSAFEKRRLQELQDDLVDIDRRIREIR